MVKIGSKLGQKFDISKLTFSVTVSSHATVVANNARMRLLHVLKGRRLAVLSTLYSITARRPLQGPSH